MPQRSLLLLMLCNRIKSQTSVNQKLQKIPCFCLQLSKCKNFLSMKRRLPCSYVRQFVHGYTTLQNMACEQEGVQRGVAKNHPFPFD